MLAPGFDEDFCLVQGVEELALEQLVAKLAVEALVVAVLPGTSGLDEERLDSHASQPSTHGPRCELRAVVGPDVLRDAAPHEKFGKAAEHGFRVQPPGDVDGEAFPAVLVDDRQHPKGTAIVGTRHHEVVSPDVVLSLGAKPNAGAVVEPKATTFRLSLRHFEALQAPDTLDPLVVDEPTVATKEGGHPSIAVPAEMLGEFHDPSAQDASSIRAGLLEPLRGAGLSEDMAGPSLRDSQTRPGGSYGRPPPVRAQKFPLAASLRMATSSA